MTSDKNIFAVISSLTKKPHYSSNATLKQLGAGKIDIVLSVVDYVMPPSH